MGLTLVKAKSKAKQKLGEDASEQLAVAIRRTSLYEDMLLFETIDIKALQSALLAEGLRYSLSTLQDFLSSQGITIKKPAKQTASSQPLP